MNRPTPEEFNPYYTNYIAAVADDVLTELRDQASSFPEFILQIPEGKGDYAYGPNKWTIKELLGHVIDTERVMAFRALHFGRKDVQELPGFDENDYVKYSAYEQRSLKSLADEFVLLRKANLFLFESFAENELNQIGIANGNRVSVKALLFIMAGHVIHHQRILKERYL
ncbi:MAG: hypothetical protein RLZ47_1183 [Bacteroidota bacterium]|jgi:hypothetical protein